jgi:hypothetical protein
VRKSDRWDYGGETFLWMLETACYLSTYLSKSLGKCENLFSERKDWAFYAIRTVKIL